MQYLQCLLKNATSYPAYVLTPHLSGFRSAIAKVRYSESLLFPLTLSLTLMLTLTL